MPAYFTPSPRIRRSPFFDATVAEGVTSFSVYNHMYMPTSYGDALGEYWRLVSGVAMWDVSCERQVELAGEDAGRLAQILCPRKLGNMKVGQGWYVPICDHNGILLNDPILLKLAEDRYWLSIADGDLLLWVKAVAAERSLAVKVSEPDVSPLAVQGPKAIELIVDLFGPVGTLSITDQWLLLLPSYFGDSIRGHLNQCRDIEDKRNLAVAEDARPGDPFDIAIVFGHRLDDHAGRRLGHRPAGQR